MVTSTQNYPGHHVDRWETGDHDPTSESLLLLSYLPAAFPLALLGWDLLILFSLQPPPASLASLAPPSYTLCGISAVARLSPSGSSPSSTLSYSRVWCQENLLDKYVLEG